MVDDQNYLGGISPQNSPIGISNEYTGYIDTLELYRRRLKDCPQGVELRLQRQKFLMLQFNDPATGKATVQSSGEQFTETGIINAVKKCWLIADALTNFDDQAEFWIWYEQNILAKGKIEDKIKTYREIFAELENAYFNGKHKNTKRKRDRNLVSDIQSFKVCYGNTFKLFNSWDCYPNVADFKTVVERLTLGTKTAKDTGSILKKIAELSHNNQELNKYIDSVNFTQTIFSQKQSIDYQTFLQWYQTTKCKVLQNSNRLQRDTGLAWLWISAMGVLYGLRPSEIMAAKNINTVFPIDGVNFPAITDPINQDKLLYLSEFTFNGCSIKTGSRVCKPLVNAHVMAELEIEQFPGMPRITSHDSTAIPRAYRKFLINHDCPITQAYAFRHLSNQLGELNGIPQEIRARSLGHSVSVNESVYKKRSNLKTTVNLLTEHAKQPLPLNMAIQTLQSLGVDTDDKSVKMILNVIYQISN